MIALTSILPDSSKTEHPDANFPVNQSSLDEAFRANQGRFAKTLRCL